MSHVSFLSEAGKRKYYNLDTIISVGYRVQSQTVTRFHQWATQRLKEYRLGNKALH